MNHKLKDNNVLITGASSGIGKAIAEEIIGKANYLFLIARRTELLDEIINRHTDSSTKIVSIQCDVSKKSDVDNAYQSISEHVEIIDVAILNAGVGFNMKPENYDYRRADEIIGTNYLGVIYWIDLILPKLLSRKSGVIAATSSLSDNRGYSGSGFYCASKAALSNYLEGLRIELRPHNISVITIKPGFVKTQLTDKNKFIMPFMISSKKAAEKIVRGIEKGKRVIQFPWPMVVITKLIGALPGNVYEFLEKFGPRH